jgi:hypothetical protein
MATSIAIEEESGTGSGRFPEHNGYYAGDFWAASRGIGAPAPAVIAAADGQPSGLGGQHSPLVR